MNRMNKTHLLLLAIVSLTFLRAGSCARIERPYPPPKASQVVSALLARGQRVTTLRGETRMSHASEQGKVKGTVRLMAAAGGKLRFDLASPFDTPLATLITDGQSFSLVDAQKGRHYHGPASPCNVGRMLQLVLSADDVRTILGGSTPVISHDKATLTWDARDGAEVLTLQGTGMTQTIRLDGNDRSWDLLQAEIKGPDGKILLWLEASGWHKLGGLRMPRTLHIKQPRHGAELWVTYRKTEINLELPAAAFILQEAQGLPSQRVTCDTVIKEPAK